MKASADEDLRHHSAARARRNRAGGIGVEKKGLLAFVDEPPIATTFPSTLGVGAPLDQLQAEMPDSIYALAPRSSASVSEDRATLPSSVARNIKIASDGHLPGC